MPLTADRVKESTTTTGTGAITLAGAASGFRAFSAAFSNPSTVYYAIVGTTEWEVGTGTFTTTLSRDSVLASSNAGALVNFSAGTKDVFSTIPSDGITNASNLSSGTVPVARLSGITNTQVDAAAAIAVSKLGTGGTIPANSAANLTSIPAANLTGTATSLTLVTPILGTPTSGALTNCTSIPVAQATGALPIANGGTGGTIGAQNYVYRTTNGADKNQDTNFADDGILQFSVSANKDYIARFVIRAVSNNTAKLKLQLTGPASPTLILYHTYSGSDNASGTIVNSQGTPYATAFSTSAVTTFGTTNDTIFIEVFLQNGANAGTVKLQYAQSVSTNITTRTLPGSIVTWQQLN